MIHLQPSTDNESLCHFSQTIDSAGAVLHKIGSGSEIKGSG